jgi:PAS domain S-box-containing protein
MAAKMGPKDKGKVRVSPKAPARPRPQGPTAEAPLQGPPGPSFPPRTQRGGSRRTGAGPDADGGPVRDDASADVRDRARAAEALRAREAHFKLIHDNVYDVLFSIGVEADGGFRFLSVNRRFVEVTGLPEDQVVGKLVQEVIPEPSRALVVAKYLEAIRTRQPVRWDEVSVYPSGKLVGAVTVAPAFDGTGACNRLIGAVHDITERMRAEEVLRASEARYHKLFSEMTSGFCLNEIVCDASGAPVDYLTLEVNAEFERIMGVTRQQVVGQLASRFMGREELDAWLGIFGAVALTGRSSARTEVFSPANQKTFEGAAFCPEPGRFAVTFTDVTVQVRARRILEARLRLAEFAAAHTVHELLVATIDEAEALTASSAGLYHFLLADQQTLSLQAWSTRTTRDLCTAEGGGRHYNVAEAGVWVDCVRQRRAVIHNDYASLPHRHGLPEGHAPIARDLVVPVFRGGRIVAILGVGNKPTPYVDADVETLALLADVAWDIAEHKQTETEKTALHAQLIEIQKLESVGRLAGGVAHDFNNSVQAILLNTEMALADAPDGDPLRRYLTDIQASARHSADLTAQLLALARKQTAQPRVLDLNRVIAETLPLTLRLIGEDIVTVWTPAPQLWHARIDPTQLGQVLTNLALNARDAIAGVGRLGLATANVAVDAAFAAAHPDFAAGDYVRLTVADDGCGMDAETLAHIFEPFFTTKPVGSGTGLGLATVYGIVRQNGGAVTVESAPGRGSTFGIWLPRVDAPDVPPPPLPNGAAPHGGTETILLVEDEPALLRACAAVLGGLGYAVLVADDPGTAVRAAAGHAGPIHLLLTDVVMPEMNGRALADRLTAARPALKRLYMSGYAGEALGERGAVEAEAPFLAKPFAAEDLARAVRAVLDGAPVP